MKLKNKIKKRIKINFEFFYAIIWTTIYLFLVFSIFVYRYILIYVNTRKEKIQKIIKGLFFNGEEQIVETTKLYSFEQIIIDQ